MTRAKMPREDENLVDYILIATKAFDGSPAKLSFVYPPLDEDPDETDFCENVTMFTFPHGYVHSWDGRSLPPPPAHNLFTLTDAQGDHLYGASISFFETSNHVKSLCLLARRPFYTAMLRYLEQLLLVGLHQARFGSRARDSVEKALCNLFHEVPVPYRGLSVQMQIGELELVLERPPLLDFPFEVDAELMLYAFMVVDPRALQQLYHHVLLEHRVLIVGNDSVLVTAVVETLKSLVFPLVWLHVVIPNIPDSLDLATLLDAPVPFLAGAHTGQLQHVAIPSNVVKYDLTESRLVVPSATKSNKLQAYQPELESVVLPPLPEASTRLLQRLNTTRLADPHSQKKELQQKLWDRRIQLQKSCMATSGGAPSSSDRAAVRRAPVIAPKGFFLVKQSLVHKKMMKAYLDVIATMLQDIALCDTHPNKPLQSDKFVAKKPSAARPFYKLLAETAQFQSFVSQHDDYVAGQLTLEEATKCQFVHKTLLSTERFSSNQADASLAVALALTKTFMAHAPQAVDTEADAQGDPASDGSGSKSSLDVVFPALSVDFFGEPRRVAFPSMATDVVHSSLGAFLSPSGVSTSRRASKDTSDWMQSFIRTVPLPSALLRVDPLTASASASSSSSSGHNNNHHHHNSTSEHSLRSIFGGSSSSSSSSLAAGAFLPVAPLSAPAPFKRSRTIDRLKKASPFYRTMTQKALDSTLSSLASAAAGLASTPAPTPTRPSTVVRSIWLITTSSCSCRDRVVLLTQQLVEQLQRCGTKTAPQVADAYCELIRALAACGHPSEAKAVFEECVSGSALLSLGPIASMPHFWRPFSALLRCYVANGLVQRAFDLLAQVEIEEEQLLDPALGVLEFSAHVLGAATEAMVERVYVTFSCGNLGMSLAPRSTSPAADEPLSSSLSASSVGCELIGFQEDEHGEFESESEESLERTSGLRVHDLVETINGEFVLHRAFPEIITILKQASRPLTVTFVRGVDRLHALTDPYAGDARRSSSSASTSSTSAVLDGRSGGGSSSLSSSKAKPRRDLCDRFGLLPNRGIRLTALADCECCGARLSMTQIQSGWATSDTNDCTTRCSHCGHRFVARLCLMLGVMTALYEPARQSRAGAAASASSSTGQLPLDATVEQFEYLSMPAVRRELAALAQRVPLSLLSMKDLRDKDARIYWNIVVKLLSLEVPLDFMDLPDATTTTTTTDAPMAPPNKPMTTSDDHELRLLGGMVMQRAERLQSKNPSQKIEDILARVLKALELQAKQQRLPDKAKPVVAPAVPGRKRWSLLGGPSPVSPSSSWTLRGASPMAAGTKVPTAPALVLPRRSNNHDNDNDDDDGGGDRQQRSSSDDERETDIEDMRTVSVTDSVVGDDVDSHADAAKPQKTPRGGKFMPSMPSLPSAPFQRSSRAVPSTR